MARIRLDELDHRLVKLLSQDARVSNRTIANQLGVAEGTVRGRIKRLQSERLITFTAIVGLEMAHQSRLAFVNIQADLAAVHDVAQALVDMPDVDGVMILTGEFNILALCLFEDTDALAALACDRILILPGVRQVETAIAARTFKYNLGMARIVDGDDRSSSGDQDGSSKRRT